MDLSARPDQNSLIKSQELAHIGCWDWDLQTGQVRWSDEALRLLGLSRESFAGNQSSVQELVASSDRSRRQTAIDKTSKYGEASDFQFLLIRPDGQERVLHERISAQFNAAGRPVLLIGSLTDETHYAEVKQNLQLSIEKALAADEEHADVTTQIEENILRANRMTLEAELANAELNQVFETSGTGMRVIDKDFNMRRVNGTFAKMAGVEHEKALGKKCFELMRCENCDSEQCHMISFADQDGRRETESKFTRPDGREIPCIIVSTQLSEFQMGMVQSITDISYRSHLDELERSIAAAEASNEAKTQFLANMSHEIRTPLNGIVGMTELLYQVCPDEEQQTLLGKMMTEAEALLDLINRILDFSKIEHGKLELEEVPFDLRVTLEDLSSGLAYLAERKQIEFSSFLDPETPVQLIGDPGRIRQVLKNLVGNAIKFTDQGEVSIMGSLAEDRADQVLIRFTVKDTGIGIPEAQQAAVFDVFFQADASLTRRYGGTGLGTTISKQLVEAMGGEIGFSSREGEGTTFWFSILLRKALSVPVGVPTDSGDLRDKKVLVVDDNQNNCYILEQYLKSWGSFSVRANSVSKALTLIENAYLDWPFDLILSDVQMPDESGFDLARKVRKLGVVGSIPIVLLTSAGRLGDGRTCRNLGIDGYLYKPIKYDDLHLVILQVLGLSGITTKQSLVTRHTLAELRRDRIQILFVEDYPTNQMVGMRHLRSAGYQVDLAEDGRDAIKAFRRKQYDLVLMDIQMPDIDGYEATRLIRETEAKRFREQPTGEARKVPIIAMTAHAFEGYRDKCLASGMDDFISKPLWRRTLMTIVDKWARTANPDAIAPSSIEEATPTLADGSEPMDLEQAIAEFEGDREFLFEVLADFLKKVNEQIGQLREAIDRDDMETVWREAHAIKGGAANLTATLLSQRALELEEAGKQGDISQGLALVQQIENEYHRLEKFAQSA